MTLEQVQPRRLTGTPGNDVLAATADGQLVLGLAGHDILTSTFNRTTLDGGSGNDELTTTFHGLGDAQLPVVGEARQFGGNGADILKIEVHVGYGQITNVADGGDGADTIDVSAFLRDGSEARNIVTGGKGEDNISATTEELQADTFFRSGANYIDGGSGNDTISARASSGMEASDPTGRNIVRGGSDNDSVFAFAIIKGDDGGIAENIIHGGTGDDNLEAMTRTGDNVSGSTAINRVHGGAGDDNLIAQQSGTGINANAVDRNVTFKNRLDGGTGNDTLFANSEIIEPLIAIESASVENTLIGGAGNDEITGHAIAVATEGTASAVNWLSGGSGDDALSASVQNFSETSSGLNILKGAPATTCCAGSWARSAFPWTWDRAGFSAVTAVIGWRCLEGRKSTCSTAGAGATS